MNSTLNQNYTIDCTGDACVGDHVQFERAVFAGSFRKPRFVGMEAVEGEIIADSYGSDKQQHTFTLRLADGSKLCIKGRNLYRNGVKRLPWADETDRKARLGEKHYRGDCARELRAMRLEAN